MDSVDFFTLAARLVMPSLYAISVVTLAVVLERCWSSLCGRIEAREAQRLIDHAARTGTGAAGKRGAQTRPGALGRVLASWRDANGHRWAYSERSSEYPGASEASTG